MNRAIAEAGQDYPLQICPLRAPVTSLQEPGCFQETEKDQAPQASEARRRQRSRQAANRSMCCHHVIALC